MSDFSCPVVRLEKIEKHPNADSLSLTEVEGCTVVLRTGDFKEGDLAVYVPVDAVIPESVPGTEFLKDKRRIRAARLRGIFSMGLLLPLSALGNLTYVEVGGDAAGLLRITKYEEPVRGGNSSPALNGKVKKAKADPKLGPVYDLESYRKFGKKVFKLDDYVVVTEKIHGTNFRFGRKTVKTGFRAFLRKLFRRPPQTVFHVGSHKTWRAEDDNSVYWKIAKAFDLAKLTEEYPDLCFYGEIYGNGVQDLQYGCKDGELRLGIFDIYDSVDESWLDCYAVKDICDYLSLPTVPEIYNGPFVPELVEPLCNGKSTIDPKQIREGVVIRKLGCFEGDETNVYTGRCVLKLVGEDYLLRKGGTEHH